MRLMFPMPENVETEVRRSFSAVACWGERKDEEDEPVVVEEDVATFSEEVVVVDDDKSEDNDPEFE